MAARRVEVKSRSLASVFAALLAGCLPSGQQDSRCSGYLGCSSKEVIVPPPDGGPDAPPPPLHPIGTGCGKHLPLDQPITVPDFPAGYKHYTVMGTGATLAGPQSAKVGERTFWVRVPADYDFNKKYPVIYIGQGCGGYGVADTSTLQLFKTSQGGNEEAIYVALDIPRDMADQDCYDEQDGPTSQEWEAFALFQSTVDANYCVDNDRVYVSGYDSGGLLAVMWGCYFAGDGTKPASNPARQRVFAPEYHVRALASDAQFILPITPDPACNGSVAAIWIIDTIDTGYGSAQTARDRVLQMNGCTGSPTASWHPELPNMDGCLQYTACPAAYPVVFCTTTGFGHADQHERAIPAFTTFFAELPPTP
jgi:poly(3-hydroxybutyrate) depolymerase